MRDATLDARDPRSSPRGRQTRPSSPRRATSRGLPASAAPEIAIAGRSNVGKSTLLNRLAGRKGLARTSKTPGRTRGLVMFRLALRARDAPDRRRCSLIDLPGYGYARVSQAERRGWQPLIEGYTRTRRALALFVILIDARRGIEDEERQLYEWLGTRARARADRLHQGRQAVGQRAGRCCASAPAACSAAPRRAVGAGRCWCRARRGRGSAALWAAIFQRRGGGRGARRRRSR